MNRDTNEMMMTLHLPLFTLVLSALLNIQTNAFVAPIPAVVELPHQCTRLTLFPDFASSFSIADGVSAATYIKPDGETSGALSTLRIFFVAIAAAVFGLTAIAYLTAAFIVPKAAQQLEEDTRKLRPGLWEEYEAKLQNGTLAIRFLSLLPKQILIRKLLLIGESMVNRPDLLQELGNIMQPIILQNYEQEVAVKIRDDNIEKETTDVTRVKKG